MVRKTALWILVTLSFVMLFSAPVPYTAPEGDLDKDGNVDITDLQCMVRLVYAFVLAGYPGSDMCQGDDDCLLWLADTYCRPGFTDIKVCLPACLDSSVSLGENSAVNCADPDADSEVCFGKTQKLNADLNCDGWLGNQDLNFQVAIVMDKTMGPDGADYDGDGRLNFCDDDSDGDGDPDVTDCEPLNAAVGHTVPEACNYMDEDCDGQVDEDLGTTTCGLAGCENTVFNCVQGELQECDPYLGATPEECNDVDDDCDGAVDEEFPTKDLPCDGADTDLCEYGTWTCTPGGSGVECINEEYEDVVEICDGLDNDCDGEVDDVVDFGFTTCGLGVCRHTVPNCENGELTVCDPMEGAWEEEADGLDNDCDGVADEDFIVAGTVVITEIMQNPACSSDYSGEWFEIYNASELVLELNGWVIADDEEDYHVVDAGEDALPLNPGEYFVFGRSAEAGENGGVPVDYVYQNFQLNNSLDQVSIVVDGLVVDAVEYDGGPEFPDPDGASMSLSSDAFEPTLNNAGSSWCAATTAVDGGCGDLGTPGGANPLCDADDDGHSIPGGDCDETNPLVNPGMDEICNGIDDNCDTTVDEGFDAKGSPCDGLDSDQCENGSFTCTADGLAVECVNEDPAGIVDVCNGMDDNCDGSVDEDFDTKDLSCDGADTDDCENGTWTCTADGSGVECVNETVTGIVDICDGLDNDCDGSVDEDFSTKDVPCDGADTDSCENGTWTCTANGLTVECVNENPAGIVELCNGLDDDCDGSADEDFNTKDLPCDGADTDSCENGTWTCTAGGEGVECVNETETNIVEICDQEDNDCDGEVDEDWVCCLELGDSCGGNNQCCSGSCNVNCCEADCSADTWVCEDNAATMRDYFCDDAGQCTFQVTATEDCGQNGASGNYQCDDQKVLEEFLTKGCSGGSCYSNPSWNTVSTCLGTCGSWCLSGEAACGVAPEGTQNASDCASDGWYCNGIDREQRDYKCDGTGTCIYEVLQTDVGGADCNVPGLFGPCVAGVMKCQGGELVCTQVVFPDQEVCDNVDNNCDGTVDAFDEVCFSECEAGVKHCFGGEWDSCSALVPKACTNYANCQIEDMCVAQCPDAPAESCNGADDDCDGGVDETFTCTPNQGEEEACGNCGTRTRTCTGSCNWGGWSDCGGQGVCSPGQSSSESCGLCGTRSRSCSGSCQWNDWEACLGQGVCSPAASESQGCGLCGTQSRSCSDSCQWGGWSGCGSQGVCAPGQLESQGCGNCGTQTRTCNAQCGWDSWGTCSGQGVCSPGGSQSQGCGLCGTQSRSCTGLCQWGSWGSCGSQGVCSPGTSQSQGCGLCGTQSRSCSGSCQWGSWGGCGSQGVCSPGQNQSGTCGNCGDHSRSCGGNCQWGGWGSCTGQGECSAGSKTSSGCANSCQSQTCNSSCEWPDQCTSCSGSCSSFYQCGLSCPATHHPESYNYSSGCGGSCCSDNRSYCKPNCGSSFYDCGLGCPAGYHAESYNYSSSCLGSCCSDNRSYCKANSGSSFYNCGLSCPSGYHAESYNYSSSCLGSCCSDNRAYCKENTGSSFYVCGLSCPAGYYVSSTNYSSSCLGSCCSKNRAYCKKQ